MIETAAARRRAALLSGVALFAASPAWAQPAVDARDAQIAALQKQVEALVAKVDSLQAKVEAQGAVQPVSTNAQPSVPPAAPTVTPLGPNGGGATIVAGKPSIQSGDGRFTATFHGVMQWDAASYSQKTPGPISGDFRRGAGVGDTAHARDLNSGSNFRRARMGVDGRLFGDFDYNLLWEFGGAGEEDAGHIQELWVQYSGIKPWRFRAGAFPPSVGLEDQASTNGAPFLERPAISDISRGVAGGDFREGAELWANGDRWYMSAAVTGRVVGVVNSQASGVTQPFDTALGYIGRIAVLPVKTDNAILHLGLHGTYVPKPSDTGGPDTAPGGIRYGVTFQERPELRVDGTRLISTGAINADNVWERGLELAGQYRNFYLESEIERIGVDRLNPAAGQTDPRFGGWYVEGSWITTGERRKYNLGTFAFDAPTVDHPFDPQLGSWGAFEFVGRYSVADLNYREGLPGTAPGVSSVRGGEQTIMVGGLNWYMNSAVRFMVDYARVKIDRLSPSAATFATPAGAQVGQTYNVLSVRSQFAF
jgi:phosphate-selective porin OprO/OprP